MFSGTGSLLRAESKIPSRANSALDIQVVIVVTAKDRDELIRLFNANTTFTLQTIVDPKTVSWLKANIDPIFGYPNIVRFSWATCKTLLETSGKTVRWYVTPFPPLLEFRGPGIIRQNL